MPLALVPRKSLALGLLLPCLGALPAVSCKQPTGGAGPSPSASAAPSGALPAALASALEQPPGPERSQGDDSVRPVYPMLSGPPDPIAKKICDAINDYPARRRAACCKRDFAPSFAEECARNVTGAIQGKAFAIDPAAVDRCVAAIAQLYQGCDWVDSPYATGTPLPAECLSLGKGSLAPGASCRSTLECEEPLRCLGLGPTTAGRCGRPRERGQCNAGVDVLATYLRADDLETRRPECTGFCDRARCVPFTRAGEACKFSGQCGPGGVCSEQGKCEKGESVRKAGEACFNNVSCAPGLRCQNGHCASPHKEGAACEQDTECRGICLKTEGKKTGTCSANCAFPKLGQPASSVHR